MATAAAGGAKPGFESLDAAAMPFITVDDHDRFEVNPEAVRYLKTLTGRVAVVSIAGIYRTGKSYLLNQVMGKSGAFTVGPTVKACTKGIWLWGKAMEIEGSDLTVLFLDTEGLGSTVRSETYDCRIFALALLLSSYFMYNSFGTIDGNAISKLSIVVNLTKHIHVRSQAAKSEDSGTEFNQFFPHFLWVVRDFSVKLEKDGRKISARDYLEDALKPEEGLSEATEQKNAVRMLIRNFFPERDCVTMVRPVTDEKQLMNLSSIPAEGLRPEFRAQIDAMKRRIFSTVRPKTLYGKPLNGAMLASLADAYVAALNTGGTPTISAAWDRVVDTQCTDAVDGAVALYGTRMKVLLAAAAARTAAGGGGGSGDGSTPSSTTSSSSSSSDPRSTATPMSSSSSSSASSSLRGRSSPAASSSAVAASGGAGTSSASPYPVTGGASSSSSSGGGPLLVTTTRTGGGAYAEENTVVEDADMHACHGEAVQAATRYFAQAAVQDPEKTPPFELVMRSQVEREYARFRRVNEAASGAYCLELLDRLHTLAAARLHNVRALAAGTAAAAAAAPAASSGGGASSRPSPAAASSLAAAAAAAGGGGSRRPSAAGGITSTGAAGGDEITGLTPAVVAAAGAVVPAAALAKEYRASCDEVTASYLSQARGPSKHRVLADYLLAKLPPLLLDAALTADETTATHTSALTARVSDLNQQLAASKGREKATAETLAQEKRSFAAGLEEAARRAAEAQERLNAQIATQQAELERLQAWYGSLLAKSQADDIRAHELTVQLESDLHAAHKRIDEVQSARITALMDMTTLSQRLAEAEAARGDAERLVADLKVKVVDEAKAAGVLLQRCIAAENETVRLREQTELLYESVRVQKDLLHAKNDEKEECEYQWGVAKAKLAQIESERAELQAQINVATNVAGALKTQLLKQGKTATKGLVLDRIEQRLYDSLAAAGTAAAAGAAGTA